MVMFSTLTVVVVSWVCTGLKTSQLIHLKYAQFIVNSTSIETVFKKQQHTQIFQLLSKRRREFQQLNYRVENYKLCNSNLGCT